MQKPKYILRKVKYHKKIIKAANEVEIKKELK